MYLNRGEEVLIWSRSDDITALAQHLHIPVHEAPLFGFFEAFNDPAIVKETVLSVIKNFDLQKTHFHFTHKKDYNSFLIMSVLSGYGNCHFHGTEYDHGDSAEYRHHSYDSLRQLAALWKRRVFYPSRKFMEYFNLSFFYRPHLGVIIAEFGEDNLDHLNVEHIRYEDINKLFYDTYSKVKVEIDTCDHLFMVPDLGEMSSMATEASLNRLVEFFQKQNDIKFKLHPNRRVRDNWKNMSYPPFIPAELIVPKIQKTLLSVYSATFRFSTNFKDIKSISCIELLDWKDKGLKQMYRDEMDRWGVRLYPKSYTELEDLMNT